MRTDDLIGRLARAATPVRPLPPPAVRTSMWLVWAVLYLVIVALAMDAAISSGGTTMTRLYVLQQGAALVTGIVAARAAFVSVVPGASRRVWVLPIVSAAVWIVAVLWNVGADLRTTGVIGVTSQTDWPCVASMLMGGVVLGGPLVWMLRGGAPLTPGTTAFLAGLAALILANIEACLTRSHAFAMTVLLWHGTTIGAAAVGVGQLGRHWLRWPALRIGGKVGS